MKKLVPFISFLCLAVFAYSQSSLLQNGSLTEYLAKRYEIRSGTLMNGFHTDVGPYYREDVGAFLDKRLDTAENLSKVDQWLFDYHNADNHNWSKGTWNDATKPLFKRFYTNKSAIYSVKDKQFELLINPVILYSLGSETDYPVDDNIFKNERGLEARGNIGRKIGFYTYFTDNQARYPTFVNNWIDTMGVIPGEGFWKDFKETGVDHYTARAHITWSALESVKFTFGHGRNFIGNGVRSLILSDFAKDYLHLRINTRVWKFNYQNLFAELTDYQPFFNPGENSVVGDYGKKYLAAHYLSLDIRKNLSIGLYEGVMFHNADSLSRGFELNYLNPIIFYRAVEHSLGSPDNAMIGLNVHYLPVKKLSLYGQFVIDEFKFYELLRQTGWFGNKFGIQLGLNYVDAFGINNLDYTFEYNRVRPFTYQHHTSGTNFVHFNQPLAHPLGANFNEIINRINYMPAPKLHIQVSHMFSVQGLDSAGMNFGSNVLNLGLPATEYDNEVAQGVQATLNRFDLSVSYMIKHNLSLNVRFTQRNLTTSVPRLEHKKSSMFNVGVRWNAIPKNLYF